MTDGSDTFKKRFWSRLLTQIEEKKVVPVIGPELLLMDLDGEKVLFYDYLADQLADALEVDLDTLPQPHGLNDVVCAYLADGEDPSEIYFSIQEIISNRTWPTPEPLKQIAAITHFDFFLSTTFDSFTKQAIDEIRFQSKNITPALAYSNMGAVVDLPVDFEQSSRPLVYQLFGKVSTYPDYAVSEDDLLKFNHRLQSRDLQPRNLFDLLRGRTLLKLGCWFPDLAGAVFPVRHQGRPDFLRYGHSRGGGGQSVHSGTEFDPVFQTSQDSDL